MEMTLFVSPDPPPQDPPPGGGSRPPKDPVKQPDPNEPKK